MYSVPASSPEVVDSKKKRESRGSWNGLDHTRVQMQISLDSLKKEGESRWLLKWAGLYVVHKPIFRMTTCKWRPKATYGPSSHCTIFFLHNSYPYYSSLKKAILINTVINTKFPNYTRKTSKFHISCYMPSHLIGCQTSADSRIFVFKIRWQ